MLTRYPTGGLDNPTKCRLQRLSKLNHPLHQSAHSPQLSGDFPAEPQRLGTTPHSPRPGIEPVHRTRTPADSNRHSVVCPLLITAGHCARFVDEELEYLTGV
ncbi:hypothetical protein BU9_CDS0073 [Klebsiella phage Kpn BU9]|nr:hypothetical protein BU9_CDS0073 [Klebsiella phage Kpn BU9]